MKKTKLWIPAHGFDKDSRAQRMSYVISCHKSVLLFEKLVLSVSFFSDSRRENVHFEWERECVCESCEVYFVFLVMEGNFFSEKLGSLKERTDKLQIYRREQKSKKYQTWLLVHHAQSHWWLIKKQLSQTRKAVYKLLLSSLIGFYSSVRESLK